MAAPTVAAARERLRTVDLVESLTGPLRGPDGQGRYSGRCPVHDDRTPSLRVFGDTADEGGYLCYGCGISGGSVVDLWIELHGGDVREAIRAICGGSVPERQARAARRPEVELRIPPPWVEIPDELIPRPGDAVVLERTQGDPVTVRPAVVHVYRDAGGVARSLVLRVERGGEKTFRPAQLGEDGRWWAVAPDAPRMLYGLPQLDMARQVVVVEGEKAADAARARLPDLLAVVTWPGGSSSVHSADWSPLTGRSVVLWPDADDPGRKAMEAVGRHLAALGCEIKMVEPGPDMPAKGDAADLDPEMRMLRWIRDHAAPWEPPEEEPLEEIPETAEVEPAPDPVFADPDDLVAEIRRRLPLTVLGQAEGRGYILKHIDDRIVVAPLHQLGRRDMLTTIAPSDLWRELFGGTGEDGKPMGWQSIAGAAHDYLIRELERLPTFRLRHMRGRGVWRHARQDGGEAIACHRGDVLDLDGEQMESSCVDGIVYESTSGLPWTDKETTDAEGRELISILESCSWVGPSDGLMLAGWIALAPICGVLDWRPHVWVTGPSGSGKSYVLAEIVERALGKDWPIRVSGVTTEAGVRQSLGLDARPIIIDEAEPTERIKRGMMDLLRNSSTGDLVVKGSTSGVPQVFHARSMFLLSSINTSLAKAADESRIHRVQIRRAFDADSDSRFQRLRERSSALLTGDFATRLIVRMVRHARETLESISVIEDAIATQFGTRRIAQQFGALLGGMHMLTSTVPCTAAEAAVYAGFVPQGSVDAQIHDDDARAMVRRVLAYPVDVSTSKAGRLRVTIGELVDRLGKMQGAGVHPIATDEGEDALSRHGLRIVKTQGSLLRGVRVAVAKKHETLSSAVLAGTDWQHSYVDRLRDFESAQDDGGRMRFGGVRHYTISISIEELLDEDPIGDALEDEG